MNYNISNAPRGSRAESRIPEAQPQPAQDFFYPEEEIIRLRPINRPRSPVSQPAPVPQTPPVYVTEAQKELFKQGLKATSGQDIVVFLGNPSNRAILQVIGTLNLSGKKLTANDLQTVLSILPASNNIRELYLESNNVGAAGTIALANSTNLGNLTTLNLGYNSIGDAGAIALANSTNLADLTTLVLWNNSIGDAGTIALANSTNLKNLPKLYLGDNRIGDIGASALANSTNLRNLATLDLENNSIGAAGAIALVTSTNLANLTTLALGDNSMSAAADATIKASAKRRGIYVAL